MDFKEISEQLMDSQPEPIEMALNQAYAQGVLDAGKQKAAEQPRMKSIKLIAHINIVERKEIDVTVYSEYAALPLIVTNGYRVAIEAVTIEHQRLLLTGV